MRDEKGRFIKGHPNMNPEMKGVFKKGEHPNVETEFKKGMKPWSYGKKYKCPKLSKALKGRVPWNKGKRAPRDDSHPDYGNKVSTVNGYIFVFVPDHPHRTKQSYVMEHRLVMEQVLGRYLEPTEVVHHIDGNKINNRVSNLMLFKNNKEHFAYHRAIKLEKHGGWLGELQFSKRRQVR